MSENIIATVFPAVQSSAVSPAPNQTEGGSVSGGGTGLFPAPPCPSGNNTGLPVLNLSADPTTTATKGQPGQLGIFGGNVYIHYSSATDTMWELLGGNGLPVLTLSTDPTATPVAAAQGQMGTFSGGLYLHYGAGTDVAWILIQTVSNLINNYSPVLTLAADPTTTPTISKTAQCGTFGGSLYIHLTSVSDTNWRNLNHIS